MNKPIIEVQKMQNGQVRLVVRNANAELCAVCDKIGIVPVLSVSNCREKFFSDARAFEEARNAIKPFFI